MRFTDELEEMIMSGEPQAEAVPEILHAEPGAFEEIRRLILGHGEQAVIPDDCAFADNDLCSVES